MRLPHAAAIHLISTIKKRDTFVRARHGKKWVAKHFVVQVLPRDDDKVQVGYTVTKRVFKSAVKRNRIKRRLRAAANDVIGAHAETGFNYILIARQGAYDAPYETLTRDLIWCLKRLELYRA